MTDLAVNIASIAALAVMASRYLFPPIISFIVGRSSFTRNTVKPFECGFCLAFWVGLAVFIWLGWVGIAYACLCAFIAAYIDLKL